MGFARARGARAESTRPSFLCRGRTCIGIRSQLKIGRSLSRSTRLRSRRASSSTAVGRSCWSRTTLTMARGKPSAAQRQVPATSRSFALAACSHESRRLQSWLTFHSVGAQRAIHSRRPGTESRAKSKEESVTAFQAHQRKIDGSATLFRARLELARPHICERSRSNP